MDSFCYARGLIKEEGMLFGRYTSKINNFGLFNSKDK